MPLFIGLSDAGLAVPGGSCIRPGDEPLVAALEQLNGTQDCGILDRVSTGRCREFVPEGPCRHVQRRQAR